MKRKRGKGKQKPIKSHVIVEIEPDLNMDNPEANNAVADDLHNMVFDSVMDTQALQTDSSIRQQQVNEPDLNKFSGSLTMKRKRGKGKQKSIKSHVMVENEPDLNMDNPEANNAIADDLHNMVFDSVMDTQALQTYSSIRQQQVNEKIGIDANSLCKRTYQEESRLPHQDPQYNEEELNAALLVIKIIMKSDAAQPFNVPVDPDLLGIHDYFDIIDTPMDFGTIRKNLEDGVKYVNSEGVFKDVQLIWENCSKYNKRGDILKLMKRMKTNFMKFWTEAKLYVEQPQTIKGYSHLQPPRSRRGKECKDGSGTNKSACQLPNQTGPHQVQSECPSIYSQIQQPPGLPPTTNRRHNKHAHRHYQLQEQNDQALSNNNQRNPPHVESNIRRSKHGHDGGYSVGSDTNNSAHKLDDQVGHSQVQSHQFPSVLKDQPSTASNIGQRKLEQRYPVGPNNTITACQLQDLRSPSLVQSQHQTNSQRNQPQRSCNQPYPSPPQPDTNSNQPQASVQQHNTSSIQPRPSVQQPETSSSQSQASQAPQQQLEVQNDITSISKKRQSRVRGPTRCLKLWNRDGKRIYVTTNESGQPVGDEVSKLTSFLGTVARDGLTAPLIYADWRAMPEANKENMWQQVQLKFDIDPICKDWVLKSLSRKWKDWKAKLKIAHYNTHTTDEERIADRDERVPPDQWAALVSYWSSAEGEARSARNRASRAHQKFNHATGTKSFARLREEERIKRPDGKEPSRSELFVLTRTRRDGQAVNEASAAVISQLQEHNTQQHDTSYNSQKNREEIFAEIMAQDKHGGVVTNGLDSSHSKSRGSMPTRAEALRMVSVANSEVHEMKGKMAAMEQTCAQMATQMSTMMVMISSMQKSPDNQNSSIDATTSSAPMGLPQQTGHDLTSRHNSTRASTRSKTAKASLTRNNIKRTSASRK